MRISLKAILASILLCSIVLLSGCASPARSDQMTVASTDVPRLSNANNALKGNVAVKEVTGGKETNPLWVSNVGSSDFEKALEDSLKAVGLGANRQSGKYTLTAHLEKLEQPLIGISMTVTATVSYTLVERSSGKTVLTKSVSRPYTAQFSDAFSAVERLRLANEGAVRVNITAFLEELVKANVSFDDVTAVKVG